MQTLLDNHVLYQQGIDATPYWSSVSMIDLLWQNSTISSYSGSHGNNISLCPPQKCSCLYCTCTCRMTAFTHKALPNSDCDVCNSISQYHYVTYRQSRRAKCMPTQSLSARENTITDISQVVSDSQRICYPQPSRSTAEGYVCSKSIDCSHTTYPNVNTTSPLSHLSCPSPSHTSSYADLHSPTPQRYPLSAHGGDYCYPSTSPLSLCNSSCSLDSSSLRHSPAATPNPPPFSSSQALAPISCSQLNVPERPGKWVGGEDCKELWRKDGSTSPKEGDCKIIA